MKQAKIYAMRRL